MSEKRSSSVTSLIVLSGTVILVVLWTFFLFKGEGLEMLGKLAGSGAVLAVVGGAFAFVRWQKAREKKYLEQLNQYQEKPRPGARP